MLTALVHVQNIEQVVVAHEVSQNDGPFFCPRCASRVVLKKRDNQTVHFVHVFDSGCKLELQGEEAFPQLAQEIVNVLSTEAAVSELRQVLKRTSSTLNFLLHHDQQIAIEILQGPLAITTIQRRTEAHAKVGRAVLWLLPWKDVLVESTICAPLPYERYLHDLYRGVIFYWSPDQYLQPISYKTLDKKRGALKELRSTYKWIFTGEQQFRISRVYREVHLYPPITWSDLKSIPFPSAKKEGLVLPMTTLWTYEPEQTVK